MEDLRLVAEPSARLVTELFVRLMLTDWSLGPVLKQATAVALRFVGAVIDAGDPAAPPFLTVRLVLRDEVLVIEVEDDLAALAAPQAGPGERVGVLPRTGGGRTTWSELPLPAGLNAQQVRLPRRGERRTLVDEPASGEPVAVEPAMLGRLLAGLSGLPGPNRPAL
jgi:hypothetical protein